MKWRYKGGNDYYHRTEKCLLQKVAARAFLMKELELARERIQSSCAVLGNSMYEDLKPGMIGTFQLASV